jgi:mono/diheme cytochrome c family protein
MRTFAILVSMAQLFAAWPARADSVQEQAVARGHALVTANCARCHAIGLDDKSPHEKAPPFREVVERYPSEHLAEALAEGIVSGHPDMPVFVFKPDEIEAFLAYLNDLFLAEKARSGHD